MFPHPDYASWPVLRTIVYPDNPELTTVIRYLGDEKSPLIEEYVVRGEVIAVLAVPAEGVMHWHIPKAEPGKQYFYEEHDEDDDSEPDTDTLASVQFILPYLCQTFNLSYHDGFALMIAWMEHSSDEMGELAKEYSRSN